MAKLRWTHAAFAQGLVDGANQDDFLRSGRWRGLPPGDQRL